MVFQSSALFNSLTVGENVGLWLREKRICGEIRIRRIIREKLRLVGLESKEDLRTSELSGGMKKRVAIARSLAMNPDLILYDEPTAELDPVTSDELARVIMELKREVNLTTIIVSHDLNFALVVVECHDLSGHDHPAAAAEYPDIAASLPLHLYLPILMFVLAMLMVSRLRFPKAVKRDNLAMNIFQGIVMAGVYYCGITRSYPEYLLGIGTFLLISGVISGPRSSMRSISGVT